MGGVYGLDFKVFPFVFDMLRVPEEDRPELFQRILVIEGAAAEQRDRERQLKELPRVAVAR